MLAAILLMELQEYIISLSFYFDSIKCRLYFTHLWNIGYCMKILNCTFGIVQNYTGGVTDIL
jgi:hypothetical protein